MARRRSKDKHLPRRMYLRRGAYYFVEAGTERWIPLGRDYAKAFAKYGELTDVDRPCETMNDVINRYRIEILPKKAATTQRGERAQLTRLAKWCGCAKPNEITTQDIYKYMDKRAKKAPTSAHHEVTLLHHVFKKAIRWGATTENPASGIEKPKIVRKPKRKVSDGEFSAIWKLASPQIRVAMDLALLTGLRTGDLLNLTRDNLTDDGIALTISKTGGKLLITYSPALREALASSKKLKPQVPGHYLIRNMQGQRYTTDGYSTNWQKLMRKAVASGIKRFAFSDLRKKSATDKKNKEGLKSASMLLAHADTKVTQDHYITDEDVIVTTPLK